VPPLGGHIHSRVIRSNQSKGQPLRSYAPRARGMTLLAAGVGAYSLAPIVLTDGQDLRCELLCQGWSFCGAAPVVVGPGACCPHALGRYFTMSNTRVAEGGSFGLSSCLAMIGALLSLAWLRLWKSQGFGLPPKPWGAISRCRRVSAHDVEHERGQPLQGVQLFGNPVVVAVTAAHPRRAVIEHTIYDVWEDARLLHDCLGSMAQVMQPPLPGVGTPI
jgi:hypothetical protein